MAALSAGPIKIPYVEDFTRIYYPIQTLGYGSYSVVYRCYDKTSLQKVALKIVTCQRYDQRRIESVLTEVEALSLLGEAGLQYVPKFHRSFACGATDATVNLAIAMEYISGMTLREFHYANKLTEDNYARICLWLFDILAKVHSHDVVHRDIKPDNIIIKHVESGSMYLIDFGFSCSTKSSDKLSDCVLGSSKGSLAYVAPEVLNNSYTDVETLKKSDVFSAAVTLKVLVEPGVIDRTVKKIRLSHRPPISLVLEKCLILDPARRPTAAWAAQTLQNYFKF